MFEIKIKPRSNMTPFSGERFGLLFANGIGRTDNEYTANRLKAKGYEVTIQKEVIEEKKTKK